MKKIIKNLHLNIAFNLMVMTSVMARLFLHNNHSPNLNIAYLDPGTGTMIISAIVGVFATLILGLKTFWYKIISIFKPKKKN